MRLQQVSRAALEGSLNTLDERGLVSWRRTGTTWCVACRTCMRNSPVAQRAAPALKWLVRQAKLQAEEFAYQASLDALHCALSDEDIDEAGLQRAYHEELPLGEGGLPPYLRDACRTRMGLLTQVAKRRERFILALTFALGASYWWGS